MKKLSILLALSLILSFLFVTGCSEEDNRSNEEQQDDNTVSTTPVSTTDANVEKSIQDRLDAGEEVLIGLCFQGLSDPFTLVQEQFLTAELSAIGFTTMTTESLSDVALQIQQIENFVEMGAVLIIAYPPDAESVKDTVIKAIRLGRPYISGCNRRRNSFGTFQIQLFCSSRHNDGQIGADSP